MLEKVGLCYVRLVRLSYISLS